MTSRRPTDSTRPAPIAAADAPRRAGTLQVPSGRTSSAAGPPSAPMAPAIRRALIAESAYLRAERRGFEPGHDVEDWLAAEAEVDGLLRARHGAAPQ